MRSGVKLYVPPQFDTDNPPTTAECVLASKATCKANASVETHLAVVGFYITPFCIERLEYPRLLAVSPFLGRVSPLPRLRYDSRRLGGNR